MVLDQPGNTVAESLYRDNYKIISLYVDILATRGIDRGLIGPREADRLWERHILNGIAVAELIAEGSQVVDVGSGAGLPGIPLAILRPDLEVTLVEPLLRRSVFLAEVVEELGLARVQVERTRANEHQQRYDVVTARALAPLPRLLEWCLHLRASDGIILALKGQGADGELAGVDSELRTKGLQGEVVECRAHPDAESTRVIRIRAGR